MASVDYDGVVAVRSPGASGSHWKPELEGDRVVDLAPNQQRIGEISVFRDYMQERAHFPPILNKFIYYFNKISELQDSEILPRFCQQILWTKFLDFVKVVNKLIQNRWRMCPFLGALEIGGLSEQKWKLS